MSWKRTIRGTADQLAKYTGLLRACELRMRSKLTILMYHRVLEDADCAEYPFPSLVMPRSWFEAQLDYLAERTRVLPVSEALLRLHDSSLGSKPLVCLSFDDGYVDNFEIVAPLLESRGLRGTFYITAGAVQAQQPLWYDRAAALWASLGRQEIRDRIGEAAEADASRCETRESWIQWLKVVPDARRKNIMTVLEDGVKDGALPCALMTVDQVRQLAERGHEIGSHTLWHPILTTMAEDERRHEINGARKLLQEWTKCEVEGFCYPNGDFDLKVIRQLQDAGHRHACTTQPGSNREATDRFALRRIDVTPDRVATAGGSFDPLGLRAEVSLFREGLRRCTDPRGLRK